jgi:glycosyltransferase involved in cell wall biosynthesis
MAVLISIIIPSRVNSITLPECLCSIIAQNGKNLDKLFEVIVVINGERNSASDQQRIYENISNIKFISTEILGVSNARNIGLLNAKGKYVIFLDDDDLLAQNTIQEILKVLPNKNILVMGVSCFKDDINIQFDDILSKVSKKNRAFEEIGKIDGRRYFQNVTAKVIPVSVIGNTKFNIKFQIGEDVLFMQSLLSRFSNFIKLDDSAHYLRRVSSQSSTGKKINLKYELKNCAYMMHELLKSAFSNISVVDILITLYLILASTKFTVFRIVRFLRQ